MAKEQRRGVAKKPKQEKPKVIAAAPRRFADIPSNAKWAGPLKSTEECTPCLGFEAARAPTR